MTISIDFARRLHALGLSLIPLQPGDKKSDGEWKMFQSNRCTDADLVKWFGNGVAHNMGIVTGAVSSVVVVESDNRDAESWCAANLSPTPMMTRSARGLHRYYRRPSAVGTDAIPAFIKTSDGISIELKRDGQYVVAPNSLHPSGHVYSMVQDWPSTLDDLPLLDMNVVLSGTSDTDPGQPALPPVIDNGGRNSTLWTEACRMRRLGLDADEIFGALQAVNRKRCHPPLPEQEVKDVSRRAAQYKPALDTYALSEAGDAEYFASVFGDSVRFDHLRGRWLLFNSHRWAPQNDGELTRRALRPSVPDNVPQSGTSIV